MPSERDIVEEARQLEIIHADFHSGRACRTCSALRALVDEVERRDKLIVHMHVHSGYRNNGYLQMTTPQKALYDQVWERSVKELDDEETKD